MAESGRAWDESFIAANSLNNYQFLAVSVVSDNAVDVCSGAGGVAFQALGLLQNKPRGLEHAEVRLYGLSKYIAGAAVTAGAELVTQAGGQLIPVAPTSGTMTYTMGRALYGVASGATGLMILRPGWRPSIVGS